MSRSQSSIILLILLVLIGFVGFLAWRVSTLDSQLALIAANRQGQAVDSKKLSDEITELKKSIKDNNDAVKGIAAQMTSLPESLKEDLRKEFVPSPEYVSSKAIFVSEKVAGGLTKVTGDLSALNTWEERNKLFLDYILQETMTLDFDPAKLKIVVTDVVADSLFYQMGFRKGDVINTADGRSVTNGDDVRVRLMGRKPIKVELTRGEQKFVLDIAYAESNPRQTKLDVTRGEFNAVLTQLLTTLKAEPAMQGSQVVGVRIVSIESTNALFLMGLKNGDIITKVNDQAVMLDNLLQNLGGDSTTLSIHYLREDKEQNLFASFSE